MFGLVGSGVEVLGRALYGALGPAADGEVRLGGRAYRPRDAAARPRRRASASSPPSARRKASSASSRCARTSRCRSRSGSCAALFVSRRPRPASRAAGSRLGIRTRGPGAADPHAVGRQPAEGLHRPLAGRGRPAADPGRADAGASMSGPAAKSTPNSARSPTRGYAILVLSSDVEEVAGIGDRSLVLDRGRIVGSLRAVASARRPAGGDLGDPAFATA